MEINRVGVIGAGLMGHGIAQVTAAAGIDVVLREVEQGALDKGVEAIEGQLARAVKKGRLEQAEADATRARITPTLELSDLADCDLVQEAITENRDVKLAMWREAGPAIKDSAIFATNTSSLTVIEQAVASGRPDRFVGMHYFYPVQTMRLVEVIRAVTTSDEAFDSAAAYAERQGKLALLTGDRAGFVVNRILVPYVLDAMRAYEEGVGSIDQIDDGMKAGAGHPMGPLELADFVGLDTLGSVCEVMYEEFREQRFAQPPILRKMLSAGWYGAKSGLGFYDHSGERPVVNPRL